MTDVREDLSLSAIELVILARLSSAKPPEPAELAETVHKLALAESRTRARDEVATALAALHQRALVTEVLAAARRRAQASTAPAEPPKRAPKGGRRWVLTEAGARALRAAFALEQTPTWVKVRDAHLPARGLGLAPGSDAAIKALRDAETLAVAVLRANFEVPEGATADAICDALIREALGMSGPLDMKRIRAHVLARRLGVEPKGEPAQLARRVAAATVGARQTDKRALVPALGRRWLYKIVDAQRTSSPRPAQPPLPVPTSSPVPPVAPVPPIALTPTETLPKPPPTVAADALLTAVREAIPRIGADGRFGPEKVFVSAIWHTLERDHRVPDLSLDRFKHWLVIANRDRLIDLARADLVGAMDPRLVAESEIEHLGSTFHFVLDHQAVMPGSERRSHAR